MVAPASVETLWEHYVQHFDFSQLGWLFENFMDEADADHLKDTDNVVSLIKGWLDHYWTGALSVREVDRALCEKAMEEIGAFTPVNFYHFTDVLRRYVELHLTNEPYAGFPPNSVAVLQEAFDNHNTRGEEGLKGKQLFAVLDDLGIVFHSKEERQWYVQVVKRLDGNKDGVICFSELCQIMRYVVENENQKKRLREFRLVKDSKLPFDEAEDWNALFLACDEEGTGELEIAQMKTLFTNIGLAWDKNMSETVRQWMQECDENASDTIDFGEFCILVSKLWGVNYHDIRSKCREFLKKDSAVSLKSVHGYYLSTNHSGEVFARSGEIGEAEVFTMCQQSGGTCNFKGFTGKSITCHDEKVICTEERTGTSFKMTTRDDDKVLFVASTSHGGLLFSSPDGVIQCSDGNPSDIPNAVWNIIRQEDLQKKCWSRMVPKRKPSKLTRAAPAIRGMEPLSPTSPGLRATIAEIDEALLENRSARG